MFNVTTSASRRHLKWRGICGSEGLICGLPDFSRGFPGSFRVSAWMASMGKLELEDLDSWCNFNALGEFCVWYCGFFCMDFGFDLGRVSE